MSRHCLLILALLALAGCANVEPWQRGYLAKPEMAFDPNPATAVQMQHMYTSKEAASGGYGVGGGGCGCN